MRTLCVFAACTLLIGASPAAGEVRRVWAVDDGEKVERDARNHPASERNQTWDGRTVRLFGGRNEIIAFQVIEFVPGALQRRAANRGRVTRRLN